MQFIVTRRSYDLATSPKALIAALEEARGMDADIDLAIFFRYFCVRNEKVPAPVLGVSTPGNPFRIAHDLVDTDESPRLSYTTSVDAALHLARRALPEKWPHLLSGANHILSKRHAWHASFPRAGQFDELASTLLLLVVRYVENVETVD